MRELRATKKCHLYLPGHNVHWIAAGQSRSKSTDMPVKVEHIAGDVFEVSIEVEDTVEPMLLRHHDPKRLIQALHLYPGENFRFSDPSLILKVLDEDGDYFFSMSLNEIGECETFPPVGKIIS